MSIESKTLRRRPVPARNTVWARRFTQLLVKQGIKPNLISMIGMLSAIIAGVLLSATSSGFATRPMWLIAALLIFIRLLANMFDGMVALESGSSSRVGEVFNEVPCRISDIAVMVGAGFALGGNAFLGMTAACIAVLTAYIRAALVVAGAPSDYSGIMAKPQRMWVVIACALYMGFASGSWTFRWGQGGSLGLFAVGLIIIIAGGILTVISRLITGIRLLDSGDQKS
ncbi:MAG: CDP-alcohol phosphatidyltransferase family protein [Trueperaceae bacterium]|nr:CDP-alcohol phosphatidyltransferase family protein [Trueperaceae bacterium]